ncbi:MAG: inositol monophosphatase, partial [Candidatus Melainabacteria bacterium HGW-Melainabacteria-1]
MSELTAWLALAQQAALIGGEILTSYQDKLERIRSKSCDNDLVTEADELSERAILDFLRPHFPDHGILAEES